MLPSLAQCRLRPSQVAVGAKGEDGSSEAEAEQGGPTGAQLSAAPVRVGDSRTAGKGLFAQRSFAANEKIFEEEAFTALTWFRIEGRDWPNPDHPEISLAWGLVVKWLKLEEEEEGGRGGESPPPWLNELSFNNDFAKALLRSGSDKHVAELLVKRFPRQRVLRKFAIVATNFIRCVFADNVQLSNMGKLSSRINHGIPANVAIMSVASSSSDAEIAIKIVCVATAPILPHHELVFDYGPEYAAFFAPRQP